MGSRTLLGLLLLSLVGCSAQGIYHGIYEGARVNNQLRSTPSERLGRQELPADYGSYDSMRSKKDQ